MWLTLLLVSVCLFGHSSTASAVNYSAEALLDLVNWASLPGTQHIVQNLTYKFFAGYIELKPGLNYYYWFFESQNDPANDPVVLWLDGGPGCAGESQALEDHGPLRIDKNLVLYQNPYSWNKVANVIYLDQPTGTGFSYSTNSSDYKLTDAFASQNVYLFLQGWFKRFYSYQPNDFRLVTQSYGGHFGAFISYEILTQQNNLASGDVKINFRGTAVGNPVTDLYQTYIAKIDKLWAEQVIPQSWYYTWKPMCSTRTLRVQNTQWCSNYESNLTSQLGFDPYAWGYPYSLSFPVCNTVIDASNTYQSRSKLYKMQQANGLPPQVLMMPCSHTAAYLNNQTVMNAINARLGANSLNWTFCNASSNGMQYSEHDILQAIQSMYATLVVNYSLPVLVFSGTDDGLCPTESTQDWVYGLNLTVANSWQTWSANASGFSYSGFYVQFNYNLTFVTIRNAGHTISNFQPQASLEMLQKFLNGSWFNAPFVTHSPVSNITYPSTSAPTATPTTASPTVSPSHAPTHNPTHAPIHSPTVAAFLHLASTTGTGGTNQVRYSGGAMAAVFFGGFFAGLIFTCLYDCCKKSKNYGPVWAPLLDRR
jgi:carboxypeptidase C (cathepsin A)